MLYPLKFIPVYKENVWGGQNLKDLYQREIPFTHTGESWDIACHENGTGVVSNGALKGKSLKDIFEEYAEDLLGPKASTMDKFPLLIKLIDAQDRLSLQVHPANQYAMEHEKGELGKCEMWYILHANEGAKLVVGMKEGVTKEQFKEAIETGSLEKYIHEIAVKAGDVLNIPAGLLHAIEEGIVIAEIQQNSDTVYRVYDWNRMGLDGKPRALHIQQALDVIDFEGKIKKEITQGLNIDKDGNRFTYYIANSYFASVKIYLRTPLTEDTKKQQMLIYTCVSGSSVLEWEGSHIEVVAGESVLVPASLGKFTLSGSGDLLKSFIPDVDEDFVKVLRSSGFSDDVIRAHVAIEGF